MMKSRTEISGSSGSMFTGSKEHVTFWMKSKRLRKMDGDFVRPVQTGWTIE